MIREFNKELACIPRLQLFWDKLDSLSSTSLQRTNKQVLFVFGVLHERFKKRRKKEQNKKEEVEEEVAEKEKKRKKKKISVRQPLYNSKFH